MASSKISQAVILSAGLGTRLRPLTDGIPKVMIPLLGKPLLWHHITRLKSHGVADIFINLHYLPKVITDYFGDGSQFGVHITYALETPTIMGTAGGVKNFEKNITNNFFVIYGDVFSQVNYTKMADAFFEKEKPIAMEIVGDTNHPEDSDLVELDREMRFTKIHIKPHSKLPPKYHSMRALFIFHKKIFGFIPEGKYSEIDHEILPAVLQAGENIYGYETDEYLKDIGTLERYRATEKYLLGMKNTA